MPVTGIARVGIGATPLQPRSHFAGTPCDALTRILENRSRKNWLPVPGAGECLHPERPTRGTRMGPAALLG
jgi:hypothetical protein